MLITHPKWAMDFRLLTRDELRSSPSIPYGEYGVGGLLKRHKTLPHPRETTDVYRSRSAVKPRALIIDTGIPSSPNSQTSSPRILKHASKRIGVDLPPTPPTHSRQSSTGNTAPTQVVAPEPVKTSLPSTPTNLQSPPTPDVTPPRMASRPKVLSRPPTVSDRYSSSRTDSFKTARENPYSSDEDEQSTVRPVLSAELSRTDVPQIQSAPVRKLREIGLGLGLESDNDITPSPKPPNRRNYFQEPDEFVTFDGEWSSATETAEVECEWDDNLQRNVTVRRRPAQKLYNLTDSPRAEVLDDDPVTPTNATKLLREYPMLESFGNSPIQSTGDITPKDKYRQAALWPEKKDSGSPSTPDIRRFSTMSARSANSTVIEAMVVEAPPQRRKTLRHTKKQLGLREISSDQSTQSSVTGSTFSSDVRHKLVHKSSGLFQRSRKHHSVSSTSASTTSTRSRKDIWSSGSIPVVVVPVRRSSMKSSLAPSLRSTSSRRTKRSMSLSSAPLSNSSKAREPGYFDLPKRAERRMSDVGSSSSQRTIDFPPVIPVRRSSLSAPTSRNTSRAGSLTADSLKAHNVKQLEVQKRQPVAEISSYSQNEPATHLSPRDHNGDPFFGSRLSTHVTPLSSASHETAGTFHEISEAQAMALYSHQNKSLLVIEQPAPTGTLSQQSTPKSIETVKLPAVTINGTAQEPAVTINGTAQEPAVTINGTAQEPATPPQPRHTSDEVDSPLRNPRDAPQPPSLKFIPATPAVTTPGTELQRQLGYDLEIPPTPPVNDLKAPKRGLSLIRRALQSRRFSESGITRSFSTKRRQINDENLQSANSAGNSLFPSVSDQPKDDSKLHPFWRPAHFWDDLEDDNYTEEYIYPPIDNRPGPPKRSLSGSLKRTFAILPIRDEMGEPHWTEHRTVRRTDSGNLRVVKNRSSKDGLRWSSSAKFNGDRRTYRSTSESEIGTPYTAPGYGAGKVQAGWTEIKSLGRRMSEKRRERRNDKLRSMISGPRDAIDGVAMVVGGHRLLYEK